MPIKLLLTSGKKTLTAIFLFTSFGFILAFTHCSGSGEKTTQPTAEPLTELQTRILAVTSPLPEHAFAEGISLSQELIDLGKMLYYEPRLSKSGLISCNTCHNLATFGVDQLPVSIGHGWQKGPINSPTVLNAAFHKTQFWDGRAADVEEQAGMPILDPLEMAATEEHVLAVLNSIPEYVARFKASFPQDQNPMVYQNVGIAIGAFERILLTPSPFDRYLQGDDQALTSEQKQGLTLFLDAACHACHRGPVLGGDMFAFFKTPTERKTGQAHPGRFSFTGREADRHFFKVPSLLNVAKTYPYLHDGTIWDLAETVNVVAKDMLNKEFSEQETTLIVEFLNSLTGEIPSYALELPLLPASTGNTPRPRFDI